MKHFKTLTLCMVALLFITACSNDDDTPPSNNTPLLLKQRITSYPDDSETYTETFNYTGNVLTSIVDEDGYTVEFIYENDLLVRLNNIAEDGTLETYNTFAYNASNALISYTVYMELDMALRFELTYNSNNTITENKYSGNHEAQNNHVSETTLTYVNNQLMSEVSLDGLNYTFEYDTNHGMYENIAHINTMNLINDDFIYYIDSASNNLLKSIDNEGGSTTVYEEFQYTYNSDNYPATATFYLEGELEETIQYIYE